MPTSTPEPQSQPTAAELDEAALREGFELAEGIRRLGRMTGVASNHRNTIAEDEAFARKMNGKPAEGAETDEDMQHLMAARDIIITPAPTAEKEPAKPATPEPQKPDAEPEPAKPAEPTPAPAPTATATATVPASATPPKRRPSWWPAALVATSLMGGGGAGYIAYDLLHPAKDTDTDTISVLDFPTERK